MGRWIAGLKSEVELLPQGKLPGCCTLNSWAKTPAKACNPHPPTSAGSRTTASALAQQQAPAPSCKSSPSYSPTHPHHTHLCRVPDHRVCKAALVQQQHRVAAAVSQLDGGGGANVCPVNLRLRQQGRLLNTTNRFKKSPKQHSWGTHIHAVYLWAASQCKPSASQLGRKWRPPLAAPLPGRSPLPLSLCDCCRWCCQRTAGP